MPTQLLHGSYLGEPARHEVVLGQKLARSLYAEVGSEIVAVVQAADGSLGNELFRVSGFHKAISEDLDRTLAIVHRDDYASLFVAPGKIHEIAIWGRGALPPSEVVRRLEVAGAGEELLTWQDLQPQLAALVKVYNVAIWIFGLLPILHASLALLVSLADGSGQVQPGLTYSISDEADFLFGALIPWGERPDQLTLRSEFGTYPTAFYLEMRFYF